jgi:cytochrome c-type protein NapC
MNENAPVKSKLRTLLHFFSKPSAKYSLLTLVIVGFAVGILFWGGFHAGLDSTNTTKFCVGCHEMNDTVYLEYQETIHYTNRSGMRAGCPDCHVPKDFANKMIAKVKAANDVWGNLTGTIDTKEKFEAKRMEMAQSTWDKMKASDSRECRNCHTMDAMSAQKQKPSARKKHASAKQEGKTCIDCHKGIAHLLPKEYKDPDE